MSHSHPQNLLHCVYAAINRRNLIPTDLLEELWAYNVGIGRNKGIPVIAVGGIENHIHLCIGLPPTMRLADVISVFKANSSRWMKEKGMKDFSWQRGYGAFSVSPPQLTAVKRYLRNQRAHHAKRSYEEEFIDTIAAGGHYLRSPASIRLNVATHRTPAGVRSRTLTTPSANPRLTAWAKE